MSRHEPIRDQPDTAMEVELTQIRDSLSHVLAQSVLNLFPNAKIAVGSTTSDGFYYDFDLGTSVTEETLPVIEEGMRQVLSRGTAFTQRSVTPEEVRKMFNDQPYKLALVEDALNQARDEPGRSQRISLTDFEHGHFVDLCAGRHVANADAIEPSAFRLTGIAGAYWLGKECNKMLTRISGTAWRNASELKNYVNRIADAKKRDHRILGRELGIFAANGLVGTGLPLWLPNGATVRRLLEDFIKEEERKSGYAHVYTPALAKRELYELSGHWQHYEHAMFPPIELENEQLVLRPMNCPHHILIFADGLHSYRELPIRIAELGTMYRYEKSGVVNGLSRVRTMTLNDAHIFCRRDQMRQEIVNVMALVERAYRILGIKEYRYRLSLRDPTDTSKYVANDEMWRIAEQVLRDVMNDLKLPYTEVNGEAAFYGPKIDIQLFDFLGHEETGSTIQIDFHLPDKFDLTYVGEDGARHRPVIIHRSVISTMERMTAYLLELYAGAFPVWLAPIQVAVLPIDKRHSNWARSLALRLLKKDLRPLIDDSEKSVNARVRLAQTQKVPFTLVIGDREIAEGILSIRSRGDGTLRQQSVEDFESFLEILVKSRSLTLSPGII
ncbi:MAG: threonine--tRNA ligase [Candidatus Binataceae bacterium]